MPVLQFKGKTAVEQHHRLVPHHVIDLDPKLSLAKKPSLDGNLIIEGDNLLALKALMPTHAGRFRCIFIDPPYNTGNEGWIYNDNLQQPQFKEWIGKAVGKEGEDACRHDKWCCMMYPRLQLLRELLCDDGAIFVTIDNAELHRLRAMMDEIFGEENFIDVVTWLKKVSPSNDATWFSNDCDYVVVYARSKALWRPRRLKRTAKQTAYYRNPDDDSRGPWNSAAYTCNKTAEERPNLYYPITNPFTKKEVWPSKTAVWYCSEEVTEENVRNNLLYWGQDGTASAPRLKIFLSEANDVVPRTLWHYEDVGSTQEATSEVREILGGAGFDSPKPTRLIERILEVATDPKASHLVLDAFAGSGTTGHAVLAKNAGDGGNRNFVLVQMPYDNRSPASRDPNICSDVTAERVRRVISGYEYKARRAGKVKAIRVPGIGGEFSYARLGSALLDESRGFRGAAPSYEALARYIWFTETSRPFDAAKVVRESGRIGVYQGTSYYLLYAPDGKGRTALDREFVDGLKRDKSVKKVVYCEKVWVHREELAAGGVVAMVVPFNLK